MWRCFFALSLLSKKRDIEEERELKLGQRNGGRTDGQTRRATAKEGGEKKEKGGGEEEEEGARAQKRKFGEDREKRDTMRIGQLDRPYIHKVAVFLVLSLNDSLFLVVVLDKTRDGQDHDLDLQDHHWRSRSFG